MSIAIHADKFLFFTALGNAPLFGANAPLKVGVGGNVELY